ncbi:MAG: hypothetical protein ACP5PB_10230 [Acidimicrobiales bacterium]
MRRFIPAILLLVLVVLAGLFALLSWHQAHETTAAGLYDCSSTLSVKPRTLVLSCADANTEITDVSWSNWGQSTAFATGTARWNDCTPSCAAGTWREEATTAWAYRVVGGHYTRVDGDNTHLFAAGPFDAAPYPPAG